ncbi:LPS export ABC transporter permease LptF [Arsenophonus symbiont of Ornithomya chloropus]|uniref:LPS export ABC transporter permease LptF n=1 Tax=Arsenophonus symbiont of Ornithomya chloropus TaxID=634121 RepID=UPI0032B135A9
MIIIQYLVKETLKRQLAIIFILIFIFFSQKTISILSSAVQGNISLNLIFPLLGLGIPEMAQLILPLSLFLGLLITYSKLYFDNEIIVMHACGLGKKVLIIAAVILALFTTFIAIINVNWMLPWSARYQEKAISNAKLNPNFTTMAEGQFKTTKDQNLVIYINDIKGKNFNHIFMAQLRPINKKRPSVVIAKSGRINEDEKGNKIVLLDKGTRYEGTAILRDFKITDFEDYKAIIDRRETRTTNKNIEQKNMLQLWNTKDIQSQAEFHWRLTLVFSVLIMDLMVIPLSEVNPRQGRLLSILPAMLLYLLFFLLQSTLHASAKKGEIDPKITLWLVNFSFLTLAIILNIWDISAIRRIRSKFSRGNT